MRRPTFIAFIVGLAAFVGGFLFASAACAQAVPAVAGKYKADLIRLAHAEWGMDAPVPVFAAQLQQESGWNPLAVSQVGARGMAQFMPATARWWCDLNDLSVMDCQPSNPIWGMRALLGYDRWLFERVRGESEYDRLWASLRAYNGGLGHWQKEAALALPARDRQAIDQRCGQARRSSAHCPENLGYPWRILEVLQKRYRTWGREVVA